VANQAAGWKTYEYAFHVQSDSEGQVWVALGISAVWETEMTYYVDNVRVEIAPAEQSQPVDGRITVEGVEVSETTVVVRGKSALPDGVCVSAELWADGTPQAWWPVDACAPVERGAWELVVPQAEGAALQPGVQYMLRAYQPGGPNIVATFPFSLDVPARPPSREPADDPALLLPDSAELLSQTSADLNGDGTDELIFLAGFGGSPDRLGYDLLALLVLTPSTSADAVAGYELAWHSGPLVGDRAEPLQVQDIKLQVFAWSKDGYDLLRPQGGHFDGQVAFGESGVRTEDLDGDGLAEILASYGPAASLTDVYRWDGQTYVYQETLGDSEATYERVPVAGAGLLLEVPAGWIQMEAGVWAAPEDEALRLGVRWADLQPPQEPEAVLLPQPSSILHSEPVQVDWGKGRKVTIEMYGEASQGAGRAPVKSVETHMLTVVAQQGTRRAYDIYVGAPDAERLGSLEAVLERAVSSVTFE